MGGLIAMIIVGVATGALMAYAPKGIWWATTAWTFRNPEANEPSDAAYGLTRVAGVLLAIFTLVFGGVLIGDHHKRIAAQNADRAAKEAEANFVAPPPEKRGVLPVVGYFARQVPRGFSVDVYYIAPDRSASAIARAMASHVPNTGGFPCYSSPRKSTDPAGRVSFTAELIWAPKHLSDMKLADLCRLGRTHKFERFSLGPLAQVPPIVTASPVVDADGIQLAPASPANVVPKLAEPLQTLASRPTRFDRGPIPVLGYELNTASIPGHSFQRYLDISYKLPENAGARPASGTGLNSGCEILAKLSAAGTETVTVDLRMYWSDPFGYEETDHPKDDDKGRVGGPWSSNVSTLRIPISNDPTAVLTNGAVISGGGRIVQGSAPGNRVPER